MKHSLAFLCCLLWLAGCGSTTPTSFSTDRPSFNFGNNLVGNTLTRTVVQITNHRATPLHFNPALTGDPGFSIVPASSCTTINAGATCGIDVNYLPTHASAPAAQSATLQLNPDLAANQVPTTTLSSVALSGISAVLSPGTVTPTANPQVALYTITPPFDGSVTIQFGPDSNYGLETSTLNTPAGGGTVSTFVAGMRTNSTYHMQASIQFVNGIKAVDGDHTFTTGAIPGNIELPSFVAATTPGLTPQPGVELINPTGPSANVLGTLATDLSGNVIWSYLFPDLQPGPTSVQAFKPLPNGHFLLNAGVISQTVLQGPLPAGTLRVVREIDLAGNTIQQITIDDLNTRMQAAGYNINLLTFHHDVTPLPNGHWLVLSNTTKQFTDLPGYPGITTVAGDVIIDLDTNLVPVWVWNEFDHLDINRHPYSFPDWTHTNAIVYSPDDGNFLVSMRHQNWIVKVDYKDGKGTGNVLWRLGQGGDFTLQGGTDPTDWFYAQHRPAFISKNTTGVFSLSVMDNGDDRIFPAGAPCGQATPCLYTTVPIYQVDEAAKTATLTFHDILPPQLYSYFGGNTEPLQNGNVEFDLAGVGLDSDAFEVTQEANPQVVWHLHAQGSNMYRAYRVPSLYPGVQW